MADYDNDYEVQQTVRQLIWAIFSAVISLVFAITLCHLPVLKQRHTDAHTLVRDQEREVIENIKRVTNSDVSDRAKIYLITDYVKPWIRLKGD